jgi:hypothetical protein
MSGRKRATTRRMSTSLGSDSRSWSRRPTGVPKRSGQKPTRTPKSAPKSRLAETERSPGRKKAAVPTMILESRSRPTKSVPSRWAALGRAFTEPRSMASGSWGRIRRTEAR